MRERLILSTYLLSTMIAVALGGCAYGAVRSSPDNPTSAGGLTPNVKDREAGLVAVAPGLDLRQYKIIVVERFPVTDPSTKDEGDQRFGAKMSNVLQLELVRRLSDSGLFQQVINTSQAEFKPTDTPAIRLQGAITRLGRGSQAARYFGGLYGAGATRAQADMQFADAASSRIVIVTADRRRATMGWFGGSDERHLEESFDDMARDLARFLVRLSRGEVPKTAP
jgi:hypothetical protein